MPTSDSSAFHSDQLTANLQLCNQIGQLLDLDSTKLDTGDIFLTKLRHLQNLFYLTQNRLDTFDVLLPTVQQHYLEMTNLTKLLNEKQHQIVNCQNEKSDEYESARLTTMAEMKFVDNQLQSFDVHAKPPITHSQVTQLQKDVDNTRCEYEILQQQMTHWMPSDEPTIDSLTIKVDQVRDQLRAIEDEISLYVTDAFQMQ